jgi:hypothetical protein
MSIRPCMSVRMEQPGSHWTDFDEIWYLRLFRKSVEKTKVSLQSDKNNGHFHKDVFTFMTTSRWILLRMRNVSNKSCRKNQNTCFMFSGFFSRKSYRLWDNVEKYGADGERRQYGACAKCEIVKGSSRVLSVFYVIYHLSREITINLFFDYSTLKIEVQWRFEMDVTSRRGVSSQQT